MSPSQEIRPDLDEGIDREVLGRLRQRFMLLNRGRLKRATDGLSPRQQTVLKLLPLFFHVNHPLLPGYVSGVTPAGVARYEPEASVLAEAQRLTRSFSYKARHGKPPTPIHGLFLMGSLGTLAQADKSDLDVWVCHASELSDADRAELARKCQLIEAWATTLGAEAHFFLIDPARFVLGERDAQLSAEDCGSTQHYLLLDEFYRTAIWLAGRTPLWWLVPVHEEGNYAQFTHTLLSKRFIRENEFFDLGNLAHIPPGEFVGAGMWQIYKGIESPYKSLLKLLLTEVYASEHPQVQCLSLRFKKAVFANRLNLDELDPYVALYQRLEEYLLARNEPQRLELVRRSLYLKANKKLTRPPSQRNKSWQRLLLERLTEEWGWSHETLATLDERNEWKVLQVASERQALVNELNASHRFLIQLAHGQQVAGSVSRRDLNMLGRRLHAAFERKAGKIEFINPGISADVSEANLTLVHQPDREDATPYTWALYANSLASQEWLSHVPLKRSRQLLELLAWAHRNGVIDGSTRLTLHPDSSDLSEFELFNLLGSLQDLAPLPLDSVEEAPLLRASVPRDVLLLVNVGVDPLKQHRELNVLMTTERTDPLSYSGVHENLVMTLDQITLNSWNELFTSRHDSPHALLDCIRDYLNSLPLHQPPPRLTVRCFCHNRATAIAQRVEEVFATTQRLWASGLNVRYLLQVQKHFHLLELNTGKVRHVALPNLAALQSHLGQQTPHYSPLYLDHHALAGHELALVLPMGQPECIQVFYRLDGQSADVYVLDEHNALWHQRLPYHDEPGLLLPLQRFLHSLLMRRNNRLPLDNPQQLVSYETLYYQIVPAGNQRARRVEPRPTPQLFTQKPFYDVQAIIEQGSDGQNQVSLYCNQREFTQLDLGSALYATVVRHILDQRQDSQRYRCYITDLDLSGLLSGAQLQSTLYLRYKAELERALNAALAEA